MYESSIISEYFYNKNIIRINTEGNTYNIQNGYNFLEPYILGEIVTINGDKNIVAKNHLFKIPESYVELGFDLEDLRKIISKPSSDKEDINWFYDQIFMMDFKAGFYFVLNNYVNTDESNLFSLSDSLQNKLLKAIIQSGINDFNCLAASLFFIGFLLSRSVEFVGKRVYPWELEGFDQPDDNYETYLLNKDPAEYYDYIIGHYSEDSPEIPKDKYIPLPENIVWLMDEESLSTYELSNQNICEHDFYRVVEVLLSYVRPLQENFFFNFKNHESQFKNLFISLQLFFYNIEKFENLNQQNYVDLCQLFWSLVEPNQMNNFHKSDSFSIRHNLFIFYIIKKLMYLDAGSYDHRDYEISYSFYDGAIVRFDNTRIDNIIDADGCLIPEEEQAFYKKFVFENWS